MRQKHPINEDWERLFGLDKGSDEDEDKDEGDENADVEEIMEMS
jgi:hypothetical protein